MNTNHRRVKLAGPNGSYSYAWIPVEQPKLKAVRKVEPTKPKLRLAYA
jgi:hypothetical protein